jgi:hypothetical protein
MPVLPPLFVDAQPRVVQRGEPLVARYRAPGGEETDRIALVRSGDPASKALMFLPPYEAGYVGSVTFGTHTLEPGAYEVVLVTEDDAEVVRDPFQVQEPGARPMVEPAAAQFAVGEPITVGWRNAPGQRFDWIGIYKAGDPDLYNNYLAFAYTNAATDGEVTLDALLLGEEMLPPGDYVVRLLLDDAYQLLAEATFRVTE